MYEKLADCYSVFFEGSYKPCDQWTMGEFVLGVAVVLIGIAVAVSVSRQARR